MRELLTGLVPGLPESAADAIVARADGVPLYAVETVRMLIAEGRLEDRDGVYVPIGPLDALAVPETLQALIAARLDTLDPADRGLLTDAAVLGQSFSVGSARGGQRARRRRRRDAAARPLAARAGRARHRPALPGARAAGPSARRSSARSPTARWQSGTGDARHLAAARHFEASEGPEVAGALAYHYLDAYRAAPEGSEGDAIAGQARIALRAAAERAASLGSNEQALAYLESALEVTSDPAEEADLHLRAAAAAEAHADRGRCESARPPGDRALARGRRPAGRAPGVRRVRPVAGELLPAGRRRC